MVYQEGENKPKRGCSGSINTVENVRSTILTLRSEASAVTWWMPLTFASLASAMAIPFLELRRPGDLKEVDVLGRPRLLDERAREGVRVDAGEAHVRGDLPGRIE